MCQALRELMKEEIQEEIQEEIKAERQDAADSSRVTDIKNLMKKLGLDATAAMEALNISPTDQIRYMAML